MEWNIPISDCWKQMRLSKGTSNVWTQRFAHGFIDSLAALLLWVPLAWNSEGRARRELIHSFRGLPWLFPCHGYFLAQGTVWLSVLCLIGHPRVSLMNGAIRHPWSSELLSGILTMKMPFTLSNEEIYWTICFIAIPRSNNSYSHGITTRISCFPDPPATFAHFQIVNAPAVGVETFLSLLLRRIEHMILFLIEIIHFSLKSSQSNWKKKCLRSSWIYSMVASPIVRAIASFHCFYNFLHFIIALKYK